MRFNEFRILENNKTILREGARIDHAEDLIYWEGSAGARRAIDALKSLEAGGQKDVTIKWDGSPAIVFGRNADGEFVLTDKSGFTASGYNGKTTSADDLEAMLSNRKVKDPNPKKLADRKVFIANMKDIFDEYEKAVPTNFRGYYKGDLLYYNKPKIRDGNYVFKPNIVEYAVDVNSDLGKKIGASKTAVVIHRILDEEGREFPLRDTDIFQGNEVLVVPPVSVEQPAQVDDKNLDKLAQLVNKNSKAIDTLLNKAELEQMQMKDFSNILYTYTNSKVDTGLQNLGVDFAQWLENNPRISDRKKSKVLEYVNKHSQAFNALWDVVRNMMAIKDNIIQQFNSQEQTVRATIPGHGEGGEGYVLAHPKGDIKLVSREYFTKANREVER